MRVFECMHACYVLGCQGWQARSAVPALTESLSDEDATVRRVAARAIYDTMHDSFVPKSRPAIAALRELLRDEDPEVRLQAVESLHWLHEVSDAEAARVLIERQQGAGEPVRLTACGILNLLDPEAVNEARQRSPVIDSPHSSSQKGFGDREHEEQGQRKGTQLNSRNALRPLLLPCVPFRCP